ncbi:hypothetical protein D187_007894 [Cystobacter fuscus DSM 2262]|uniref:Uncharacterized protein n=1 Tax=Cystobacter fuscus (strain ATCC 25194 / DSM 2262 / NBRC 100088 / M29) TaxID=1242864 RepID=S9P2S7_CYSF2|nr:hypothetical protein [Cystobacter fuscus]EPX56552.1 hypothetical protein D187_007894 [Cystobacter fuscus DSM 2262]
MANETSGKGGGRGPFERGGAYDEVGPELGRLHEAWDVETGKAVLQLLPTERVDWRPEGPWRVSLLCEPEPVAVTVRVEEAPASMPVSELADLLVLTSAAVTRVEDSERLRAHLASGQLPPRPAGGQRAGHAAASRTGLLLGLSVWLLSSLPGSPAPHAREAATETFSRQEAPTFVDLSESELVVPSYPLPKEPFLNQMTAPCPRRKVVVEINGGCWVTLEQKPPCDDTDAAEYQGKCYMPVGKRKKLPQSVGP